MRLLFIWLSLIILILYGFFYVNSTLEKTIAVKELIKQFESSDKITYSTQNVEDLDEVLELTINKNSEIVYVLGNRLLSKDNKHRSIELTIDRPNKNVVLLLNSKEKITWNILPINNTNIELIIYDGKDNEVLSKSKILKYKTKLDFTLKKENMKFIRVLNTIKTLTNIDKLSYFYAQEELPSDIYINSIQNDKKLSLNYLKSQKLDLNFDFHLVSNKNDILNFDLYGPKNKEVSTKFVVQDTIISPDEKKLYKIMKNGIQIIDVFSKKIIDKPIPVVKKIHNPRGLAYDSLSDMIYLANKDGKFYVFDAEIEKWIAIRKYIDDFDINSFSYDEIENIYVASTWKKEGLIFFDQKGNFSTKHSLEDKLKGFNYHYMKNEEIPKLYLIPKGEGIILVFIKDFVQKIWYYDKLQRKAYLTYNFYNS